MLKSKKDFWLALLSLILPVVTKVRNILYPRMAYCVCGILLPVVPTFFSYGVSLVFILYSHINKQLIRLMNFDGSDGFSLNLINMWT